ncbi:MAG: SufD family Fe-S cluster assembly protein [Candidatus Pacebacteria bacterium]|nr:SufD family Fe-S cluster assembly protein [Candidatus Paceibacterota bacterium]
MRKIDVSDKSGLVEIVLDKEGEDVQIFGTFETRENEVRELHVRVIHIAEHTLANTVLKGVAWDSSQLKLSGTIVIQKSAQHTNSFLRENILLLSPTAKAEAIPNLEIEANEVKCSHAATISNIPEEHLFYLMSRGIEKREAEVLVVKGFLGR